MSDKPALVSVGYQGRSLENFVRLMQEHQVGTVIDVRLNPVSRKPGFSKTAISEALTEAGIGYRHERALGNPKDNRQPFRQGLASARERYRNHLSNSAAGLCYEISALAAYQRIALLCYESDHNECHRSCIVEAAVNLNPELKVTML